MPELVRMMRIIATLACSVLLTSWMGVGVHGCGDSGIEEEDGPLGFIGSPCESDDDCDYEGASCLSQGPQAGLCTAPCDRVCPDRTGHPVTFCVDRNELPDASAELLEGACVSRCNTAVFPHSGCRSGYGCAVAERHDEPQTQTYACLPARESELSDCLLDLAARGVSFEPTVLADERPVTHPDLSCRIEDPVLVHSPLLGVELRFADDSPSTILGSCEMAHALASTVEDLRDRGVTAIEHGGTYRCRVIAGTDELSRHGHGDAIDLLGFHLDNGAHYTVADDWEHGTEAPQSPGGAFLYETTQRWFQTQLWNVILTPNYNDDHDDHIHVDLTPGSHVLRSVEPALGYVASE